ncbi:MAG TPA: polyphosphate kinase 2 family protein [Steroidobacteraceae bacterium]|nr:polyphosphate kinase 2 family protein [Steroidobacteraceae bacterium]
MKRVAIDERLLKKLRVKPGERVRLDDANADRTHGWKKSDAEAVLEDMRRLLEDLQSKLYADGRFAMLVVLQATDGGGKDSTIKNVITAFNPQGCTVTSFKVPSSEELRHDYLWRIHKNVPPRGEIGVFNRSHYEEVLVVRVDELVPQEVWKQRYEQINQFESMLVANNVTIVKFFLQISKDEQQKRLQDRLDDPTKQWKFNIDDIEKRKKWDEYQRAYEDALSLCSTRHAPWYIIPANHKWFRNLAISQILAAELARLPLRYPRLKIDPAKVRVR